MEERLDTLQVGSLEAEGQLLITITTLFSIPSRRMWAISVLPSEEEQ